MKKQFCVISLSVLIIYVSAQVTTRPQNIHNVRSNEITLSYFGGNILIWQQPAIVNKGYNGIWGVQRMKKVAG